MKTYTIDAENAITIHASRKAARETGAGVFTSEVELADLIGPDLKRLVEIYNSLPGVKPVTKFANRKTACEKIWRAIQGLGQPADAQPLPNFASCVEAVEAASVPETPFDDPMPEPVTNQPEVAIESAPAHVEEQPAQQPVEAAEPVATLGAQTPDVAPETSTATKKATRQKKAPKAAPAAEEPKAEEPKAKEPRADSKTTTILALLKRPGGASLADIMAATSWQKHSVRGFISGTLGKKMGLTVESVKAETGERRYAINS